MLVTRFMLLNFCVPLGKLLYLFPSLGQIVFVVTQVHTHVHTHSHTNVYIILEDICYSMENFHYELIVISLL